MLLPYSYILGGGGGGGGCMITGDAYAGNTCMKFFQICTVQF